MYFSNPKYIKNIEPSLMDNIVAFNYLSWPRKIFFHVYRKDILDIGCGTGLHALGYIVSGVKSYTGLDPKINIHADRGKNLRTSQWQHFGWTPAEMMYQLPIIRFISGTFEDVAPKEKFDIAILHNVTEHLHNLDSVFEGIARRLRPNGRILYQHHNFFSWNGHHKQPKTIDAIDTEDPTQTQYMDWEHIQLANSRTDKLSKKLNKIRIRDLRTLTEKYFTILTWREVRSDPQQGLLRFSDDLLIKYPHYEKKEFLTQHVFCVATIK